MSIHEDNYSAILSIQGEANKRGASLKIDGHMPIDGRDGNPGHTYSYILSLMPPILETPATLPGTVTKPSCRRIWLSAGHGGSDPGAGGSGYREADLAIELRDLVRGQMPSDADVWTDPNSWATKQTAPYIQGRSKAGEIVCDIHFNAYNGVAQGVEVIVPDSPTAFEIKLAEKLAAGISESIKSPLRGTRGVKTESQTPHKRLAMMRPPGENVLIEVCFIDNAAEMARYQSSKLLVARKIADALLTA